MSSILSTPHHPAPGAPHLARPAQPHAGRGWATRLLRGAAALWMSIAIGGQLAFAAYVAGFYGRTALAGTPERWNQVMARGHVAGDTVFNAVLALHLGLAVAIVLGGAAQLLPALRRRRPGLHRWNGRIYLVCAVVLSLGGLAMIWIRGGVAGDLGQHLGTSANAVLILLCVAIAWRHARRGQWPAHRRWALRLFLAVSGVWFFRIGLMGWLALNQAPVGFDPDRFVGPTLTALAFAQSLLPLAVLELYLRALDSRRSGPQWLAAVVLVAMSAATLIGTLAAVAGMWWPVLRQA